ncbi:putative secreted protein [Mycobacterium kansasii]|uniref:Putative secreted protein n=1 Tax=Mycobacterium kansasii TaxID=1768 RepID=A0A1V3WAS7_MYCKA|nr:putative secreted protein [Mycobacterium kansasii]
MSGESDAGGNTVSSGGNQHHRDSVRRRTGVTLMAVNSAGDSVGIAAVLPMRGAVVGVAHPVVITFGHPVADRQAVERAIDVRSAPARTGKFEWLETTLCNGFPTGSGQRTAPWRSPWAAAHELRNGSGRRGRCRHREAHLHREHRWSPAGTGRRRYQRRTTGHIGEKKESCRPRWAGPSSRRPSAPTT